MPGLVDRGIPDCSVPQQNPYGIHVGTFEKLTLELEIQMIMYSFFFY